MNALPSPTTRAQRYGTNTQYFQRRAYGPVPLQTSIAALTRARDFAIDSGECTVKLSKTLMFRDVDFNIANRKVSYEFLDQSLSSRDIIWSERIEVTSGSDTIVRVMFFASEYADEGINCLREMAGTVKQWIKTVYTTLPDSGWDVQVPSVHAAWYRVGDPNRPALALTFVNLTVSGERSTKCLAKITQGDTNDNRTLGGQLHCNLPD